jgi:hypothetical protein
VLLPAVHYLQLLDLLGCCGDANTTLSKCDWAACELPACVCHSALVWSSSHSLVLLWCLCAGMHVFCTQI